MAFNKPKAMEAARRAVERGQTDRAIKEYLKVVREDPKDVRVWLKLGDLYAKRGAKQDATDTYLKVAKFYSEQGFNRKAVAVYKQILKLDPRLVEVNLKLAELYRQLGLLSEAMQHFEMVAAFFHREGKTQEALATIRQLVDLDPENVATRIKLAELYSKEGMIDEAVVELSGACEYLKRQNREADYIKVAERLLWHRPDNAPLCRELANLYLRKSDPRRALQKLQVCFKASPRDVETLALLAQAFQALDQKGKAVSVLKELAKVLADNSQRSEAAEVHQKILAYVPDDPDSLAFLGRAGHSGAVPPSALGSGQMAAASSSLSLSASDIGLSAVGRPLSETGRTTGSVPLVDPPDPEPLVAEVLESSPGYDRIGSISGEVHAEEIIKILTETEVYVKYGLHQKAIDHLKRIFELDPGNVEAHEQLKDIYLSQGRQRDAISQLIALARRTSLSEPQRAEEYLREVAAIDPDHSEAEAVARELGINIHIGVGFGNLVEPSDPGGEIGLLDDDLIELDLDDEPEAVADPTGTLEVDLGQVEESRPAIGDADATSAEDDLDFDQPRAGQWGEGFLQSSRESMQTLDELPPPREAMPTLDELPRPRFAAQSSASLPAITDGDAHIEDASASASFSAPSVAGGEAASALEDDLDEADFFMTQGLLDEARDILNALAERYPNHPLVTSKLQELAEQGGEGRDLLLEAQLAAEPDPLADLAGGDDAAIHFDLPGEFDLPGNGDSGDVGRPAVLLERPVDEEDADTHYDLGLAYKEMGLYDEAIKSFSKVLSRRGVQCYLMIGLCYREQQNYPEAISQFKAGLYVDAISEREKYSLYYEIGSSYQLLGDPQEALYFLEMVHKKDPGYRDVATRIAALRGPHGGGQAESFQ
ncbi:MAG TPA: tetratricopeptide repeat protein [Kofleriaceae bacterium]|nr:tetratricopeptide repeat protein [Kofleriaceae bacterium]